MSAITIVQALTCGRNGCPCIYAARRGHGITHCPAHDDRSPSLSVTEGPDKPLWNCKARCSQEAVKVALIERGLYGEGDPRRRQSAPKPAPSRAVSPVVSTTVYEIRDAAGTLVAKHVRQDFSDGTKKPSWQRPDGTPGLNGLRTADMLYGVELLREHPDKPIVLVEGEKAADALRKAGVRLVLATVTGAAGCPSTETLRLLVGRRGLLWPDNDGAGRQHMNKIAARLLELGVHVLMVEWADAPPKGDAADFCAVHDRAAVSELLKAAKPVTVAAGRADTANGAEQPAEPRTLAEAEAVWRHWMAGGDLYALRIALGTYAANQLAGDPVWSMLVGGSGSGKTEAVQALAKLPGVQVHSTLSGEAALLSATPRKERSPGATGGILRSIGSHGVLALKDFTTILAMNRDKRAEILAALREIYDGEWTRSVGTEGGRTLAWKGKLGCIAGCTTAIDTAHAVIGALGTRFLTPRMPEVDRGQQSKQSLRQTGHEIQMRDELTSVVAGLFANGLPQQPVSLDETAIEALVSIADLASLARSPVDRDHRSEIELVPDPEAPTRLVKELAMLYRGLTAIGLPTADALALAVRVGFDCVPKLRRAVLLALASAEEPTPTSAVATTVDHPPTTTRRALEDLAAHKVIRWSHVSRNQTHYLWSLTDATRAAIEAVSAMSLSTCTVTTSPVSLPKDTKHTGGEKAGTAPVLNSGPSSAGSVLTTDGEPDGMWL